MLAEPKNRRVWSSNPRGKYWAEDKNKFGQKLLESMGWTEGKGLGKSENGIQQHIKVELKSDNKGLGFKPTPDDNWINDNNTYEQILAQLALHHNNGPNVDSKVSNLEEKSKKIRNRVHYQKFIKAKNLSQWTQKDLSSIFPKKSENSETENKDLIKCNDSVITNEELNGIKTFESNRNMNDYFKSKMDKLKIKYRFEDNMRIKSEGNETQTNNDSQIYESFDHLNHEINESMIDVLDDNKSDNSKARNIKKQNKLEIVEKLNFDENNLGIDNESNLTQIEVKSEKIKRKKEKNSDISSTDDRESDERIDSDLSSQSIKKVRKSKKNKKLKKNDNKSESLDVSQKINNDLMNNEKSFDPTLEQKSKSQNNTKSKRKIRLPSGYDKQILSVSHSVKKYHKICAAITKDKVLNTTNLILLQGYGYETD